MVRRHTEIVGESHDEVKSSASTVVHLRAPRRRAPTTTVAHLDTDEGAVTGERDTGRLYEPQYEFTPD